MKWKDIVTNAEKVKNNVEKNNKIPSIKGYNTATLCYIFAEAVKKPGKDVTDKKITNCPSCTGTSITKNLTRNEYVKLATNTNKYILSHNNTAPNYTTYQSYKVSIRLQTYCYAKIIVWYDNHNNTLPSTCWFKNSVFKEASSSNSSSKTPTKTKCTNPYKAIPYNSNSGCNAMGQDTGYFCADSMLQKMFYRLGYKISQEELARVAGTTTAGTGHGGIETAIAYVGKKYGVKFKVEWYNLSDLGFEKMGKLMCQKNTSVGNHLLYRDQYGHYEYPLTVNTTNKTIKVINSLGSMCTSSCYCGYIEERNWSTHKRYISGISQKSVLVITKT